MSQPPNQGPLYPDSTPSSPYSPPQGPAAGGGYGAPPSQQPGSGYGLPPSSSPYPGYGPTTPSPSYPPPSQPYQGYAPPAAMPSYPAPSTPYQGYNAPPTYPPPSMPYQGYLPDAPPTSLGVKRTNSRPGVFIALAVVGVLLVVGVLHYAVFGPASIIKSYLQDVAQSNGTAAYSLVCSSQHNGNLDTIYNQLSPSKSSSRVNVDTSAASYSTSNWGLTTATVHLGGPISISSNSTTVTGQLNEDFPMATSGFGWCINTSDIRTLEIQHTHT